MRYKLQLNTTDVTKGLIMNQLCGVLWYFGNIAEACVNFQHDRTTLKTYFMRYHSFQYIAVTS